MRSPGTPPNGAPFPSPRTLSCMPSSTPAGISRLTTASSRFMPISSVPPGFRVMRWPVPWQSGHVEAVCICPRIVLVTRRTWPVPWQVAQSACSTPSAWTCLNTLTFLVNPSATSSSVNFTLMRRFAPFIRLRRPPPPPPPPKAPPKMSPNWEKMSSMFMPPPPNPPGPPRMPSWPNRSYCWRFVSSLNTSYASAASLNFSSAAALSGFLSGWYFKASLR